MCGQESAPARAPDPTALLTAHMVRTAPRPQPPVCGRDSGPAGMCFPPTSPPAHRAPSHTLLVRGPACALRPPLSPPHPHPASHDTAAAAAAVCAASLRPPTSPPAHRAPSHTLHVRGPACALRPPHSPPHPHPTSHDTAAAAAAVCAASLCPPTSPPAHRAPSHTLHVRGPACALRRHGHRRRHKTDGGAGDSCALLRSFRATPTFFAYFLSLFLLQSTSTLLFSSFTPHNPPRASIIRV